MPPTISRFPTVGQIAQQFNRPIHQITYVIRSLGIQPVGRAGHMRVFDEAAVEKIGHELTREGRRGAHNQ